MTTTTTFTLEEIQKATSILSSIHANTFLNNLEISVAQAEKEYEEKQAEWLVDEKKRKDKQHTISNHIKNIISELEQEKGWLERLKRIDTCKYVPSVRFDIQQAKIESEKIIKHLSNQELHYTKQLRSVEDYDVFLSSYGIPSALKYAHNRVVQLKHQLALFNYVLVRNEGKK